MAGTISFGGIGSGIDTESIVNGLVQASQGTANALKNRAAGMHSAATAISDVSSLLAKLKSSVDALKEVRDTNGYKATSSSSAIAVSASGLALPGVYSVKVNELAQEHRIYSNTVGTSATDALGQAGQLSIAVGTGDPVVLDILASDNLNTIAGKIDGAGLRVSASLFFDGTDYRIQLRGLDTGAANNLTVVESGFDFGLDDSANLSAHEAQDAEVVIDGHTVKSSTNQFSSVMPGVTFAVSEKTTSNVTLRVDTDPEALKTKLKAVVESYNAVVNKVHGLAGFGSIKPSVAALAGDSSLRAVTSRLSSALSATVGGAGAFQTLSSIGLGVTRDGTISLDETKLSNAIAKDSTSVSALLAGPTGDSGIMDSMSDLVNSLTQSQTGLLATKSQTLNDRAKSLDKQADRESERLQRYAEQLRRQFTSMDSRVAGSRNDLNYLLGIFGGG